MASEGAEPNFENETTENLQGDVPLDAVAQRIVSGAGAAAPEAIANSVRNYDNELLGAELVRLTQQSNLRSKFFWVASSLAVAVILASTIGVGYYVWQAGKETEPAVLITWMTAVVVELLGILKIIAVYLYPSKS